MAQVFILLTWEIFLLLLVIVMTSFDFTCPSFISLIMFILSTVSLILNYEYWMVVFYWETVIVMILGLSTLTAVDMYIYTCFRKMNCEFELINTESYWIQSRFTKIIILFSSIIMMLIYIREVYIIGARINTSTFISSIGAVKNSEYHVSALGTICLRVGYALSNMYSYIFIHNVIVSKQKASENIYLLVAIVCGVISSFYSGSRGMMMGTIFAFFFYMIVCLRLRKGWKEVKLKRYLKYIVPACLIFVLLFFVSRNIVKNRSYSSTFIDYITYYLGNSQQLFNMVIKDTSKAFPVKNNLPGLYSFQFLYNELDNYHIIELPNKISNQYLQFGRTYMHQGNVYTLFGEPYHDFGLLGMLVYVGSFYGVFCYFYYKYIRFWKNTEKNRSVFLVFGSQYYLVLFSFYLAPTVWIKMQTFITIAIVLIVFRFIRKYRFVLGQRKL